MGAASSRTESGTQGQEWWTWTVFFVNLLFCHAHEPKKAELTGLIQALQLADVAIANICIDRRYAFAKAHAHRSIYQD